MIVYWTKGVMHYSLDWTLYCTSTGPARRKCTSHVCFDALIVSFVGFNCVHLLQRRIVYSNPVFAAIMSMVRLQVPHFISKIDANAPDPAVLLLRVGRLSPLEQPCCMFAHKLTA